MKLLLCILVTTFKTLLSEEELQERNSLKDKLCRLRLIKCGSESLTKYGGGSLLVDDPILLSVYSPHSPHSPVRDSKRSLSAEPLYQTSFTAGAGAAPTQPADCVCVLASQCPAELVVTESNSPVKDYSSLINPRNKVTLLTSEKAAKQTESKPVRFLERKRRTTVEDTGSVHIHHHYQDIGAKTDGKCMAGYVCCSLPPSHLQTQPTGTGLQTELPTGTG